MLNTDQNVFIFFIKSCIDVVDVHISAGAYRRGPA